MSIQQSAELYADKEKSPYIMVLKPDTHVGFHVRKFFLNEPVCDIHEMAWATSMQCRYTGHVRRRYSVAEHGCLVAELMREPIVMERGGSAFEGLMHDAHEGYVSDFAAPWKALVPDYRGVEARVEHAMRLQFGLPPKISEGVKYADWLALFIEAEQLLGTDASADWLQPEPTTRATALELLHTNMRYRIAGWDEYTAYSYFMTTYNKLKPVDL